MAEDDWPYPTSTVVREDVDGTCPECGEGGLQKYPVVSDGGWFMVVKCQACLHSLSREPWHRLGTVVLPEQGVLL